MRCSVEGCEKALYVKGMCATHYTRVRRHGDPHTVDKRRGGVRKEPRPVKHGTQWAYQGIGCRCDECVAHVRSAAKRYAENNRAKVAERRLQAEYGLSRADYDAMLESQGGVCLICAEAPEGKPLFVDHCHFTGAVRGLLCTRCNTGVGMFRDNPDLMLAAAAYVLQQANVLEAL